MAVLRSYLKSEDAFLDAAFLGSMGVDAQVVDQRGSGGVAVGVSQPFTKVEVPDEQLEEALQWLAGRGKEDAPVSAPVFEPSWNTASLHRFLKFLLLFELACYVVGGVLGRAFEVVPPKAVADYSQSLVLSMDLWNFAYISFWPLYGLSIISSVLCLFDSKTGRLLYAITTVWGLLTIPGPPPELGSPGMNFIGNLQGTASNLALALMYWSPVRQKFDQHRQPKP